MTANFQGFHNYRRTFERESSYKQRLNIDPILMLSPIIL